MTSTELQEKLKAGFERRRDGGQNLMCMLAGSMKLDALCKLLAEDIIPPAKPKPAPISKPTVVELTPAKCLGKTALGRACKGKPLAGTDYCSKHIV